MKGRETLDLIWPAYDISSDCTWFKGTAADAPRVQGPIDASTGHPFSID